MKKTATRMALLIVPFLIWAGSGFVNESDARDHYRIGTLNESIHYRGNDGLNSSHNGLYVVHNRNVFGTYYNSEFEQSLFYARNNPINETFSYSYGLVLGYGFGLLPMAALSAQVGVVKFTFTHEAAVVGLEVPLF